MGYSPWDCKELDTNDGLILHFEEKVAYVLLNVSYYFILSMSHDTPHAGFAGKTVQVPKGLSFASSSSQTVEVDSTV